MADTTTSYSWRPALDLMLEEGQRSVDNQVASIRETRGRAGAMLGYASIIAAALGLTTEGAVGGWGYAAMAGFLVVACCAAYVMWPRELKHDMSAKVIEDFIHSDACRDVDHVIRTVALGHWRNHQDNANMHGTLQRAIVIAVGGLALEAIALIVRIVVS